MAQVIIRSHVARFTIWLRFLLFPRSDPSRDCREAQPTRVTIGFDPHFFSMVPIAPLSRRAANAGLGCPSVELITRVNTLKRLRISGALATAWRSRATVTLDTPAVTSAITPPPSRPDEPRSFSECELPKTQTRIARDPEATLLQNQYAPGSVGYCCFLRDLLLISGSRDEERRRIPTSERKWIIFGSRHLLTPPESRPGTALSNFEACERRG
jgi:hypothetical protein